MSDHFIQAMVSIVLAIVGVAALSVVLSRKSQTPQVLAAGGSALSQSIGSAILPTTGGTNNALSQFYGLGGTNSIIGDSSLSL